jgi:hypothetical protein
MSGKNGFGLTGPGLSNFYTLTKGPSIAYIDKSYCEPLSSNERPIGWGPPLRPDPAASP